MKLAIVSSLQGRPEETSPETPLDTTRLARYVAERLQERFSEGVEVGLFSRETHPDLRGDAYIELRNRLVSWGADAAVHIHQDAGAERGARGWHIIYHWPDATTLVNELMATLSRVPSPMRYGGAVRRLIAATRVPRTSVLIEAGFYTSTEDEAIGVVGWGDAIVRGVVNWLVRHRGCKEKLTGGDETMPMLTKVETKSSYIGGEKMDVDVYGGLARWGNPTIYFDVDVPHDLPIEVYIKPLRGAVEQRSWVIGGWKNKDGVHGTRYPLRDLFGHDIPPCWVYIHVPASRVIGIGWVE